jgi:hypothetical protein
MNRESFSLCFHFAQRESLSVTGLFILILTGIVMIGEYIKPAIVVLYLLHSIVITGSLECFRCGEHIEVERRNFPVFGGVFPPIENSVNRRSFV